MSGEYTLYGGNGVKIKTLDATADGTYTASEGEAYGTVNVSTGGSTGGGVLVVNVDAENHVLDKTWQEIADADFAVIKDTYNGEATTEPVLDAWVSDETAQTVYSITTIRSLSGANPETLVYYCSSADDYPIFD